MYIYINVYIYVYIYISNTRRACSNSSTWRCSIRVETALCYYRWR